MSVYKRFNGKPVKHGSKSYDRATWYISKRIRGKLIHQPLPEARTKQEADRAAAKIIADALNKRYGLPSKVTFTEFADGPYTKYVEQHNEDTYGKALFIKELKRFFGNTLLADITPQDCRDYQYARLITPTKLKTKRAVASVNKETSTLSKLLTLACEQGILPDSPMRYVRKLKEPGARKRSLTPDQKQRLWVELEKDEVLMRIVTLALNLPIRKTQILKIRPEDVDFEAGELWVVKSKKKDPRSVPMNDTVSLTLKLMIDAEQIPFSFQRFEKRWHAALIEAKINKEGGTREENFHFHDLRHIFGSALIKKGVNPYDVQELFNHSDMKTSAIYITSDKGRLAEAVKLLDIQEMDGIN